MGKDPVSLFNHWHSKLNARQLAERLAIAKPSLDLVWLGYLVEPQDNICVSKVSERNTPASIDSGFVFPHIIGMHLIDKCEAEVVNLGVNKKELPTLGELRAILEDRGRSEFELGFLVVVTETIQGRSFYIYDLTQLSERDCGKQTAELNPAT